MRILHIGDFHYKANRNNYEQNLMVTRLVESLKSKQKIDFCFFTGDLVFTGNKLESFEAAKALLLDPISKELDIPYSNIMICSGNHDINREVSSNALVNFFDKDIDDNDKLDSEYLNNSNDIVSSMQTGKNYFEFVQKYFSQKDDLINPFYCIHNRTIDEKEISIISINTSWLSSGLRPDLNNLMFPIVALKEAINKIRKIEHKIILLHHPLSNLKEFNGIELEDLIHKEFNLMFSGHLHREQISTRYTGNNGIYANTTQATLTFDKNGEIGYSIIDYNLDDDEIKLERSTYLYKEQIFQDLKTIVVQVPVGVEKANQNKLRKKIISKFRVELSNANELMLDYNEESSQSFLDTFTNPVISSKSETESTSAETKGIFNFENLYRAENNFLFFGKDKCGKTSLLKKVQLHFLKNYSLLGKVPFYIDYKELEAKSSPININKLITNYYEISNSNTNMIIENDNLILLIDNLNNYSPVNDAVIKYLEENKNIKFIACSDYLASRIYFEELDHLEYEKLYFKELSRKEIRLFTEKRKDLKSLQREEVLEKITKVCQQLQLPINYWTVSLILLIYRKSNEDYNKNLFGILDLCVDEILQKKQLTLTKSKLTFEQYKEICSKIAHYLLIEFKDEVYSTSYSNLISFIEVQIKKNDRLVADSKEILDYLLSTGILKEKGGKITFRLNGLFEYFLAFYIYHHPDFKNEILADDSIYLSFKNELEIYSGFNRQDELFLKDVYQKTRNVFDKIMNNYLEIGGLDEILMKKIGDAYDFTERIKKLRISKPLDNRTKDSILDSSDPMHTESDVELKKLVDANKITHEVLEKYLTILSRVFRNTDNIENPNLIYEIFDFLLEAYCTFGFFLIDWVSGLAQKENIEVENYDDDFIVGDQMIKIITSFIPILTQVMLFDGVGHISMKKIVSNKIDSLLPNKSTNQYKLFLLYFLLTDIEIKSSKKYIDEVFKNVVLSPLKVSTFFKLNFYHGFKSFNNKELEEFFKKKILEAQKRMDEKADKDDMNRFLSKKQKRNIARRGYHK